MNRFLESRKSQRDAALSAYAAGGVRLVQRLNLTAKVQLNQIARAENREPTPEELELCHDFSVVPATSAGGGQ